MKSEYTQCCTNAYCLSISYLNTIIIEYISYTVNYTFHLFILIISIITLIIIIIYKNSASLDGDLHILYNVFKLHEFSYQ